MQKMPHVAAPPQESRGFTPISNPAVHRPTMQPPSPTQAAPVQPPAAPAAPPVTVQTADTSNVPGIHCLLPSFLAVCLIMFP